MEGCSHLDAQGVNANDEFDDGCSLWVTACQEGDLANVKQFMVKGQSVAAMNAGLRHAAGAGKAEIVSYLLARGAIVDGSDAKGFPPLFFAAKSGHLGICQMLVGNAAKATQESDDGSSPWLAASDGGHLDIVMYFLAKVKNIDYKNSSGITALMAASRNGQSNVADFLLTQGARVEETDSIGCTPLLFAVNKGHLMVCELLVAKGSDPFQHLFVKEADILKQLFVKEAAILQQLLQDAGSPWSRACERGHLDIVQFFVEKVEDKKLLDTGLIHASFAGKANVVSFLLLRNANANCINHNGLSPLYLAAKWLGNLEVCQLLVEKGGADPFNFLANGLLPWLEACREGRLAIVKLFFWKGHQNMEYYLNAGLTVAADKTAKAEVVNCLLVKDGLAVAAEEAKAEVVRFLLANGARTDYKTTDGKTARELALENGHVEIVEILDRHASASVNLDG